MFHTDLMCKSNANFKRLTGVSRAVFEQMLDAYTKTKREFGRPSKLSYSDQLLLSLMYWREHRTLFHIGQTYKISESYACKIVHAVENALIRNTRFHLPGRKSLLSLPPAKIRLDATETPIQRPQKNKSGSIAVKRSATR